MSAVPDEPQAAAPVRPVAEVLVAAAVVGGLAGAAVGAIDGLWSWRALAQFTPGLARLRVLAYLATSYAIAGILVSVGLGAIALFYSRVTRLGTLVRHAAREHARVRARDPKDALVGLSLVVSFVPLATVALAVGFPRLVHGLFGRKNFALIVAVAMVGAVVLLAIALAVAIAVARGVEVGLRALARGRLAGPLSSPWAPAVALAVLVGGGAIAIAIMTWSVTRLLPLRLPLCAIAAALAAVPLWPVATAVAARWRRAQPAVRRGAPVAVPLAIFLAAAVAAGRSSVVKAAVAYSGAGDALTKAFTRVVDRDRDRHSPWFGGGDCDDGDASVHPGADDVPDDGVDQNCVAGDAKSERPPADPGFVALPPGVPADANIVLLTIDTLRADALGSYGYPRPTSPILDEIAAEGTRFAAAWAHAPSTRYSMPAILTGRLPLDVYYDTTVSGWPGLDLRAETTPSSCAAAASRPARSPTTGTSIGCGRMDQGFDSYDNENARLIRAPIGPHPGQLVASADRQGPGLRRRQRPPPVLPVGPLLRSAPRVRGPPRDRPPRQRRARPLRSRDPLHRSAHRTPGRRPEEPRAMGQDDLRDHRRPRRGLRRARHRAPRLSPVRGPDQGAADRAGPRARAAGVDHRGRPRRHPADPGQPGRRPAQPDMMGRSLVPLLAGAPDDPDRVVFQQLSYEGNHELRGAATADCHLIYNVSPHTSWELYRLDEDPGETRDRIDLPGRCARVRTTFERWYDSAQIPAGAAAALLPGDPKVPTPLGLRFGAEVELLAVDLPPQARPGERIAITFTFAARGRLAGGWKIFVHLDGPGGQRIQVDHAPPRPFAWWRAGQFLRYTIHATVPPTGHGEFALWMGLFRGNARRPARGPAGVTIVDDRARVATMQVVR
jgi:hypothetical protein